MSKPKLIQQLFEARYEKGYRFLDRAGEVMLILEEGLPSATGKVWMQEEIAPAAANLKCPDLDVRVIFNTYHLVVDQNPADVEVDLADVASIIFATVAGRFDIRRVARLGLRSFHMHATDSIEEAESLAIRMAPFAEWNAVSGGLTHRSSEAAASFENDEGSEGVRVSVKASHRVDAPQEPDPRLRLPAHLLPKDQRQALIDQLRRRTQREKSPAAGVLIDVDCYQIQPAKPNIPQFVASAIERGNQIASSVRPRNS